MAKIDGLLSAWSKLSLVSGHLNGQSYRPAQLQNSLWRLLLSRWSDDGKPDAGLEVFGVNTFWTSSLESFTKVIRQQSGHSQWTSQWSKLSVSSVVGVIVVSTAVQVVRL